MSGAKGMILSVLLTLMADKMHDGTPSRDGIYGQEAEQEGEEEEMEDQETGNGEITDGDMSTHAQIARDGRSDASTRQNPNTDRKREWRGGGHFE
jgi:hypothetical protein